MKKSKVIQQKKNVPVMVGSSGDGDAGDSIEKIIIFIRSLLEETII